MEFELKPCITDENGVVDIPSVTESIHVGVDDRQFEHPHVVVIIVTGIDQIGPEKLTAALHIANEFTKKYPPPVDQMAEFPAPQPLFANNLASIEGAVALPIPLEFVQQVAAVVGQSEVVTAIALFATRADMMLKGRCICADCVKRVLEERGVPSNQRGNA